MKREVEFEMIRYFDKMTYLQKDKNHPKRYIKINENSLFIHQFF